MGILDAISAVLGGGKKTPEQARDEQQREDQVANEQVRREGGVDPVAEGQNKPAFNDDRRADAAAGEQARLDPAGEELARQQAQEQSAGQMPAGAGQGAPNPAADSQPAGDSWVKDQPNVDPTLNEQSGSNPSSTNSQSEPGGLGDILGGGGIGGGGLGSGGLGGGINMGTLTALVPVILSIINQQGGIGGLAEKFQRGGLGEIFNSWVNKGENREISPQQVDTALGPDTVDSIAQQTGHSRDDVLGSLSGILPRLVDTSTPDGQVPSDGQARGENDVLNSLSSLFK